jgi:hypothetical protein
MQCNDLDGRSGRRALLGGSAAAAMGLLGLSADPALTASAGQSAERESSRSRSPHS